MTDPATERAFESTVESMLLAGGWRRGDPAEWDVGRALFGARAVEFLRATQPEQWERLHARCGDRLEALMVERLARELDNKGALHVLRHGFRFEGETLRVAVFRPAHGLNPDAVALYKRNELTVTRQVPCHPGGGDTIDLLFALNGVPVATCELKNPMTGQSWRHAVSQYQQRRDPRAPVFRFTKRALVHFAADPDEVHMTTRLAKGDTEFLPFNRGSHPGAVGCGAGNPEHPSGYRSGYFWQEVLERDSFMEILGSFTFRERRTEEVHDQRGARTVKHESVVFPRYHQLDAVTRLITAAASEGPGRNYLIQHSAGSGKTNSISWLAHRLAGLHTPDDAKVFDCVLVITDRRILDRQLQDAVYQIDHAQGVVRLIDEDSAQLAAALVDGTKIVVTTLQKFPYVMQRLLSLAGSPTQQEQEQAAVWRARIADRRYAVIVDEAHSSQTGESARELKGVLGARSLAAAAEVLDWEDGLNAVVESRGQQPNLSFFAFTATPKAKTIELFGRPGPGGRPQPFHVYSMRQAIEEGFILDLLGNYTDYNTYYRLVKLADADEEFPTRRTAAALARFLNLHEHNVAQKTEVIVEHFCNHVRHRIGGRAKAMVVTSSRLHAVRFMLAFQQYVAERGYSDLRPLVAFSGTVIDPDTGEEFTEPRMNIDIATGRPIGEAALRARFDSPDYRVLIVAEKYQTGFDQPLLQAMYVDKRLDGVHAVQTLSRLNRVTPGKAAPFVLDFVNDPEDIHRAFTPYYDHTLLEDRTDPYRLETLKHELDETQVYHHDEVEAFARVFYRPPARREADDHARLEAALQPARRRFDALTEDDRTAFRDRLGSFVNLYAYLGQIIPYADSDLERLYSFGRALLSHLHPDRLPLRLDDIVELEYYRLQQVSSGAIHIGVEEQASITGPTDVGTGAPEEATAPLSDIIEQLNDRFGTEFSEGERLFFQQVHEDAISRDDIRRTAQANPFDKFSLGIRPQLQNLLLQRMADNDALVTRTLTDPDFGEIVYAGLLRDIFERVTLEELKTS